MSLETIMWTVLPTGKNGNTLNFSLFLSPQLGSTDLLGSGQFPIFEFWPKRASTLDVWLEIQGKPRPYHATLNLDPLSVDHWARVFPGTTPVTAWGAQDQSGRTIQSYSVSQTRAAVNDLYDGIATNQALAADHPPLTAGSPILDLVNQVGRPMGRLLKERQEEFLPKGDPNNQHIDTVASDTFSNNPQAAKFYKAWRFFNRPQGSLGWGQVAPKATLPTDWDFHKACAMLVDHGSLLRMLGLVIDGSITFNSDSVPPNESLIRVSSVALQADGGVMPALKRPWTHYLIDSVGFLPQPKKGSEILDGNLRLEDTSLFDVFEVDADGAALKTLDFAINIARHIDTTATQIGDKPTSAALPALRSGGFTISRNDRGAQVSAALDNAATQNMAPDDAELWADDVTRGYRIDVNFRGNWYSLCRRTGFVTVGAAGSTLQVAVDDEGYVKGPSGTSTKNPGVTVDELYLHEAMVTWKGWSLVATRPGRTIPNPPDHMPVQHTNSAQGFFQVVTDFHAKMLPRLRFGDPYRFRARTVDLAGNSLPSSLVLPGSFWDSGIVPYLRYEPISTPALQPRAVFTDGEHIENLTVRSQVQHLHAPLDPTLFNDDCQRHVVPPKSSQLMAEEHGRLDKLMATDPGLAFRISAMEDGTLMDRVIVNPYDTSFDPTVYPAKQVPVTDIALVDPSTTPATVIDASDNSKWPGNPGDPPKVPGQYVIHTGDSVQLPYLPDPLAKGLALRFPKGALHHHVFAGKWPNLKPFRLVLQKGPLGFQNGPAGTVIVTTPEGSINTLRYSTMPEPEMMTTMRFARNLTGAMEGLALRGQHWMLTPWREITLVHAVEQPMAAPVLHKLTADKALAQTFAELHGSVHTHSNSTGEIDVWAEWTDPVDHLGQSGMMPIPDVHGGYVFNRKIGYDETEAPFPKDQERTKPPRHEFGDTKHHLVRYWPVGTTRYREYFPSSVTSDKDNITWQGPNFGTNGANPTGVDVNILSSARPEVPQVLYIVPTFQWNESADGLTRTRVGRGLRIYLDRPWYSSGVGELLGIVMPTTPITAATMENIRPYVSEWGADPAGNDSPPTAELKPGNFVNQARNPLHDVALAERADVLTTVSGFAVEYNPDRQLWYCDIDMDPGNLYFPFVRLAIARLQPDSVLYPEDVRLSKVVKTEFAQLTADRTATLTVSPEAVDVMVYGLTSLDYVALDKSLPIPTLKQAAAGGGGNSGGGGTPDPIGFLKLNAKAGAGHVVRAHIEARAHIVRDDPKTPLGWSQVGTEMILQSYTSIFSNDVFWRGTVRWIARNPALDYRLVIREHEQHYTDANSGLANPAPVGNTVGERLVYLDTMALRP